MADIFISYAWADQAKAQLLADALEQRGWSVWLVHQRLQASQAYDGQIENELDTAGCIIVLWSPASARSEWVRREATKGLERGIIIPVQLDNVEIPIGFKKSQTGDLTGWDGDARHHGFRNLVEGVTAVLGRTVDVATPATPRPRWPARIPFRLRFPKSEPKDVWLGAATPPFVSPSSEFVARFTAYTSEYRRHVAAVVEAEAPVSKILFDLYACQWEPGTKITVALSANDLYVESSSQSFVWNGKWIVLRFDVTVPKFVQTTSVVLRFDIFIEGLIVARLRPEIRITADSSSSEAVAILAELKAPDTAFASYAMHDRREVFGRIRSLQIFTGMDVFLDCLSIRPGEQWKDKIKSEILQRDIFWLFWSTSAKESAWVEWEWRTALTDKTINAIQPHPLEPPDIAPPPVELTALQFGTLYESFLYQSRSSWLDRRIVQTRKVTRQVVESPRLVGGLLAILFAIALWILVN